MDKYYYVVAQLPLLYFDKEPTTTTQMFLEEAEKWLNRGDYAILSQARFDAVTLKGKQSGLLRRYVTWESQFRDELGAWRKAARDGMDFKPESFSLSLVKEGNPLQIEMAMLKRRWDYIEQIEPEHHFDLEFLILYFFKLQILEQAARYNKEKGLEIFQKISKVEI